MAQTQHQVSGAQERALHLIPLAVRLALTARRREQKELARYIGLSEGQLSERINGHTPFKAHEIAGAAEFLGVPPGFLFTDPADWTPTQDSLNVRCADSQLEMLLPNDEPAFDFERRLSGFTLAS